jgi:hypothetical protein
MLAYSLIGLVVEFFFIFVGDTTKDRVKGFVDVVYFAFTIYYFEVYTWVEKQNTILV